MEESALQSESETRHWSERDLGGDPAPIRGKNERKSEFAGLGAFLQLVGLVLLFFFPIGTVIGIGLLIYGRTKAFKHLCSVCGNRIEPTTTICSHCKAQLF